MTNELGRRRRRRGTIGPLILILVGVLALLSHSGLLDLRAMAPWWPVLLIVIGVLLLARRLAGSRGGE